MLLAPSALSPSPCPPTVRRNSPQSPDEFALASLLKSASNAHPNLGAQLHAKSIRSGLSLERGVRTSLVAMYSTLGRLDDALKVFAEIPMRAELDVPTWNAIISAYAYHGLFIECFRLLSVMLGVALLVATDATFAIAISACAASREFRVGRAIHAMVVKDEVAGVTRIFNSLISMYSRWGLFDEAEKVFEAMSFRDVVSWNAVISGLEQNGEFDKAVSVFCRLTRLIGESSVRPNTITYLSVLSAVAACLALNYGKEIHAQLIRLGLDGETSIGNSLITMYGKCGEVGKARFVFNELNVRDVISWNSMLSGYVQNNRTRDGYELLRRMQLSGISMNLHTLSIVLCGLPADLLLSNGCKQGKEIHGYLLKRAGRNSLHVSAFNAVISMYSKGNRLADAVKIFQRMSERDSYTWNAMIDAYSLNDCCNDVMVVFIEMLSQDFEPDHFTFSATLTVCGKLPSLELGKQLHAMAVKKCLHSSASQTFLLSINNALISMYSRCGSICDATKVFQRIKNRDVFSWTAMITGYSIHGMVYEALQLFEAMRSDGVMPNSVTFLGLLSACAHAGLVEEGVRIFDLLKETGIETQIEHYTYIVDLYGRSGQFEKAEAVIHTAISTLAIKDSSCLWLWRALLGACHAHKNLDLGIRVATTILELDPDDETTHILLSNIFAAFGMWKEAAELRSAMRKKGLQKEAGCSWVEIRNKKHVFVAADSYHEKQKEIFGKLEELGQKCRDAGYVPLTEWVLHDVDEVQKEAMLGSHSERIALSFALLNRSEKNGAIRVFKNLRVCGDCHNWMKFVSQVEELEIVLRDSRRFHSFKGGKCSCGDYW